MHVVNLFKEHCNGVYRLCPKLTKQYVKLTSYGYKKVNLAAQVLSSTVTNALELVYKENTYIRSLLIGEREEIGQFILDKICG